MSSEKLDTPRLAINRVYTRHGDEGRTRLVGGQQVYKDDPRIEAYGSVDELNAQLGAAVLACRALSVDRLVSALERAQHALFNLGSSLATLPDDLGPRQPRVRPGDVIRLEGEIDHFNAELPSLRSFVLPGTCQANVELHRARTVCRRAERLTVALSRREEVDPCSLAYLNRLSDALFVWARWVCGPAGADESLWDPNG